MPKSRTHFAAVSPPPTPRLALTISEFCRSHAISPGLYYKMKRRGEAPREMKVGARTLISVEAAAEWRRARETKNTETIAEQKDDSERVSHRPGCRPIKLRE